MDYQSLYLKTVVELRRIAKEMGVRIPAGTGKSVLINMLLAAENEKAAAPETEIQKDIIPGAGETSLQWEKEPETLNAKVRAEPEPQPGPSLMRMAAHPQVVDSRGGFYREDTARFRHAGENPAPRSEAVAGIRYNRPEGAGKARSEAYRMPDPIASGMSADGAGILEIQQDGYGFLRAENYLPGNKDVYVSMAQIRRFNLRQGDRVEGRIRPRREGDRYTAMMHIARINGEDPERIADRPGFDELVPVYPDERLRLAGWAESDLSLRMIDLMAPIGKGQRGLIVSPPKAGKTTMLKKIANAIAGSHPEVHMIILLIGERPEEVTDMKRSISGEVICSTFDEAPENHARVCEMALERAKRLVEMGKDVAVLMDSITRLARAYNLIIPPTGRSLSGGLDPGALHRPKKFFGAARNIENGGSLTIIATALVDTGSRMDDIIYEEFKGTGNMEIHLDRKLSDRRVFPAVDMVRSGTRREERMLSEKELDCARRVRRMLCGANAQEEAERIIAMMEKSEDSEEFIRSLNGMDCMYEKTGYALCGK